MRLPYRLAASTASFIASKEKVSVPVTSAPLPVDPYILM